MRLQHELQEQQAAEEAKWREFTMSQDIGGGGGGYAPQPGGGALGSGNTYGPPPLTGTYQGAMG